MTNDFHVVASIAFDLAQRIKAPWPSGPWVEESVWPLNAYDGAQMHVWVSVLTYEYAQGQPKKRRANLEDPMHRWNALVCRLGVMEQALRRLHDEKAEGSKRLDAAAKFVDSWTKRSDKPPTKPLTIRWLVEKDNRDA
jgi:hypothetical protein